MKVLLLNGSLRQKGCTFTALSEVAGALHENGVDTEIFQLGAGPVYGCTACHRCRTIGKCVFDADPANTIAEKIAEADGFIVGAPVYYAGPSGSVCAVLDRVFYSSAKRFWFKPGASVVSCRRAGSTASLDRLNKYFTLARMPLVSSQYWPMVHGNTPDEVRQDLEGMQIMRTLGINMAYMLKAFAAAGPPPAQEPGVGTNFIR